MANRIQIPFSFNYPSGGNLVPAASVSVAVYVRNNDGSQGSPASVFLAQSGSSQYSSIQTDTGGNVPGWVNEGTYKIVAAASGGFGGGVINFDALYGGGTAIIATNAVGPSQIQANAIGAAQLQTAITQALIPPGTILDFGGSTAPTGFLRCDGSILAQASFANLFSAIGSVWNTGGEGGGNFRLPNLIGATTLGSGTASWGTARLLGKYGLPLGGTYLGEEGHAVSVAEMPSHNHTGATGGGVTGGGTTGGGTTGADFPDHNHFTHGLVTSACTTGPATFFSVTFGSTAGTGGAVNQHQHAIPGLSIPGLSVPALAIAGQGGNVAHNNMPPFAVVNKIIKA